MNKNRDKGNIIFFIGVVIFEELLMGEEGLSKTDNELIYIGKPIEVEETVFYTKLEKLKYECYDNCENIRELVLEIVDTYNPSNIKPKN